MKISISELSDVSDKLLTHIQSLNIEKVEMPVDHYWDIPKSQRYDVYQQPTSFTIGQIESDWIALKKVVDGEAEPLAYHLVWLASILRAIGEQIVY